MLKVLWFYHGTKQQFALSFKYVKKRDMYKVVFKL